MQGREGSWQCLGEMGREEVALLATSPGREEGQGERGGGGVRGARAREGEASPRRAGLSGLLRRCGLTL